MHLPNEHHRYIFKSLISFISNRPSRLSSIPVPSFVRVFIYCLFFDSTIKMIYSLSILRNMVAPKACVDNYIVLQAFIIFKRMFLFRGTDIKLSQIRLLIRNAWFDHLWINYKNVPSPCRKAKDVSPEELVSPSHSRWASPLNTNHLELGHRGFIQIHKGYGDELGLYSHVVIQNRHGERYISSYGQSLYT